MISESFLDFNYDNILKVSNQNIKDFLLHKFVMFDENNFFIEQQQNYKKFLLKKQLEQNGNFIQFEVSLSLNYFNNIIKIESDVKLNNKQSENFNNNIETMILKEKLKNFNIERSFSINKNLKNNINNTFNLIINIYSKMKNMIFIKEMLLNEEGLPENFNDFINYVKEKSKIFNTKDTKVINDVNADYPGKTIFNFTLKRPFQLPNDLHFNGGSLNFKPNGNIIMLELNCVYYKGTAGYNLEIDFTTYSGRLELNTIGQSFEEKLNSAKVLTAFQNKLNEFSYDWSTGMQKEPINLQELSNAFNKLFEFAFKLEEFAKIEGDKTLFN